MKNENKIITSNLNTLIKKFSKNDVITKIEKNYAQDNIKILPTSSILDNWVLKDINFKEEEIDNICPNMVGVDIGCGMLAVKTSLKERGIYNPLIVKPKGDKFELVLGRKRYLAAKSLGILELPVLISNFTDEEMLLILLADSRERKNSSSYEIAVILNNLKTKYNYSNKDLSIILKQSESQISNIITLLKLPKEIVNSLISGEISYGHARCLARIDDITFQNELFQEIIKKKLSVRELEEKISTFNKNNKINENCEVIEKNNEIIIKIKGKKYKTEIVNLIKNYLNNLDIKK